MNIIAEIETEIRGREAKLRLTQNRLEQNRLEWTLTGINWSSFDFIRDKTYIYNLEEVKITRTHGQANIFGSNPASLSITVLASRPLIIKFPYQQNQEVSDFFRNYKNAKKKSEKKIEHYKEVDRAKEREKALDFDAAINIWEELELIDEAARVRKMQAEMGSVKVSQKVVHGDEVTEIKDSVLNRSNVGSGGKSKSEELREAKALLDDGIIDDDEFKQMKKEILGK